jgi:hypothetical protein
MAKTLETPPSDLTVSSLIRKREQNYIYGNNQTSQYVNESPYEDISKIEAYLNSKHTSGDKDALGRDKPFFNIVLGARNIWFRATDIDRKNIKIRATCYDDVIPAFIATQMLQEWMRKNNFGQFLNNWGLELSGYNSTIVKFVEKDGELYQSVIPWNRVICDFIDFDANPVIEILELTPAQLKQRKGYNQELVSILLDAITARQQLNRQRKDNLNNFIKLYEIHGNLPLSYLTGKDSDWDTYVQQMHVVTFVEGKGKGEYDDYTLVSGREDQSPYMLTSLIPATDGSISLMGSVKSLFDSQWMQNHTAKLIKDELDFTSNKIFNSTDPNLLGQNALQNFMLGDVVITAPNTGLTPINMQADIVALQSYQNQWKALAQEITSTPNVLQGANMPSGTAYRTTAIVQQEAHDNFEIMTENKGLAIEEMMRRFILPYIRRRALNNTDELVAELEEADIQKIDGIYIKNEATKKVNNQIVESVLKGQPVTPEEQQAMMQEAQAGMKQQMMQTGNKRFFKPSEIDDVTWKEMFDDLEWDVEVDVTGENEDKNTVLTTLNTVLQTLATNPAILSNPTAKMVFNKILSETGVVSPLEMAEQPQQPAANPVGGQQVGAGPSQVTQQ